MFVVLHPKPATSPPATRAALFAIVLSTGLLAMSPASAREHSKTLAITTTPQQSDPAQRRKPLRSRLTALIAAALLGGCSTLPPANPPKTQRIIDDLTPAELTVACHTVKVVDGGTAFLARSPKGRLGVLTNFHVAEVDGEPGKLMETLGLVPLPWHKLRGRAPLVPHTVKVLGGNEALDVAVLEAPPLEWFPPQCGQLSGLRLDPRRLVEPFRGYLVDTKLNAGVLLKDRPIVAADITPFEFQMLLPTSMALLGIDVPGAYDTRPGNSGSPALSAHVEDSDLENLRVVGINEGSGGKNPFCSLLVPADLAAKHFDWVLDGRIDANRHTPTMSAGFAVTWSGYHRQDHEAISHLGGLHQAQLDTLQANQAAALQKAQSLTRNAPRSADELGIIYARHKIGPFAKVPDRAVAAAYRIETAGKWGHWTAALTDELQRHHFEIAPGTRIELYTIYNGKHQRTVAEYQPMPPEEGWINTLIPNFYGTYAHRYTEQCETLLKR